MGEIDDLINEADQITKEKFKTRMSNITRLSNNDLDSIMQDSAIDPKALAELIKEVKSATSSNESKARAIANINKGTAALVAIAKKFL